MIYYFKCPICNQEHSICWMDRKEVMNCPTFKIDYYPPEPIEQPAAYVDSHEWPKEMEEAVLQLKGTHCSVPGCIVYHQTLDHRIPYSQGGPTSVENLWPMCNQHNKEKGDTSWELWLLTKG